MKNDVKVKVWMPEYVARKCKGRRSWAGALCFWAYPTKFLMDDKEYEVIIRPLPRKPKSVKGKVKR